MGNNAAENGLSRAAISDMLISSVRDVLALHPDRPQPPDQITEETRLIGRQGLFDSLGLVTLIVEVEQQFEEIWGIPLVLADERAMSQKSSPFRSVRSLGDYIFELVKSECADAG